ncbi:WYL domain containing protein [uncultured Caudovirales phage]|uniref:WYL domain containing protein n=1 Tax=uncultured Caudovirales phage TaxID=2100421 RepID=A0A6J5KT98_9CAUD|nr:WYL domain containing protein [uncultured Caudovirales phage]
MYTQDNIYATLKAGIATVIFTKVDGSERIMRCTLKDEFLPEEYRGKGLVLTEVTNSLRVFDLEANAWRSFRVESVISVQASAGVQLNG